MSQEKYTIFWFRRDLRLDDNIGLYSQPDNIIKNIKIVILIVFII